MLLLIVVSIYKFLNIGGFFRSEITEYPVMCKKEPTLNKCQNPDSTLNKTTYKILKNRQEVLYWSSVDDVPRKLTKCAIKDRKNWSCKYNDESAEFGFKDGKFWNVSLEESILNDEYRKVYYPSRTEYLMTGCKNKLFCFLFLNILD